MHVLVGLAIIGAILYALVACLGTPGGRLFLLVLVCIPVGWYFVMLAQAPAEHARIQAIVCEHPDWSSTTSCEHPPPPPYSDVKCMAFKRDHPKLFAAHTGPNATAEQLLFDDPCEVQPNDPIYPPYAPGFTGRPAKS